MIAQRTKTLFLNQLDFDRLQTLIDTPRYRATHPTALALLREVLCQSSVVPPLDVPADVVTMRSRITVREGRSQQAEEYTLVYPEEADIEAGKVSVLAPLGLAMLGKRVGDPVRFSAPLGERQLRITEIHYQPEAAGELHL